MIGVDITRISRFKNLINKPQFIKRILHQKEIIEFEKSTNKIKFLASRWAIKEAIFKCDNQYFHFDKILLTVKNRQFQTQGYQISTSNEDDYYIAIALKI